MALKRWLGVPIWKLLLYLIFLPYLFSFKKSLEHVSSSRLGLWGPLPWLALGMLLTHLNSTSALHYLQFILWFSKLAVSKLYLDDTVHHCQHCLSSEGPLAAQLVSLELISFSLAPTKWMCSFTPSQTCLVPDSFRISVPSQPCTLLPYSSRDVDTELYRQQFSLPALKYTLLLLLAASLSTPLDTPQDQYTQRYS